MGLVGAVLSFVCAGLLSVYLPVKRVYSSVPQLSLILWFIGCNVIQGVNGLLWNSNVELRAMVWCDIGELGHDGNFLKKSDADYFEATRFTIAAKVGIAGALVCLARDVELFASTRSIVTNPIVVRNRLILDFFLCLIFPLFCLLFRKLSCLDEIIYSAHDSTLDLFVQDHRFDLFKDLGCVASFHRSVNGSLAMFVPVMFLSCLGFALCGTST